MTQTLDRARGRARPRPAAKTHARPRGLVWLLGSELAASLVGFAVVVRWARVLGLEAFSHVEYAAAVAAWLLVVVRGGIDVIAYREVARHPRLIHRLTELVLGLRAVCALAGYALVALVATFVGAQRGSVVALAGLMLGPSAFVVDLLPRARGRLGWLALAQGVRAAVFGAAGFGLVSVPEHLGRAAVCAVIAEAAVWAVFFALHTAELGVAWPRFQRRAWIILAHRGSIASLIRFGRVTLYAADVLALGWLAGSELGPYAAARRLVFALVALGLVVPAALAPAIARGWLEGPANARQVVGWASRWLWALGLPAAVGLVFTAARAMPVCFGAGYSGGAIYLALIAARLPWLLSASLGQSALLACRREGEALRLVGAMSLLAALALPIGVVAAGPRGAALAALVVEIAGAAGAWVLLRALGAAPGAMHGKAAPLAGSALMALVCWWSLGKSLFAICLLGATTYGVAWWSCQTLICSYSRRGGTAR